MRRIKYHASDGPRYGDFPHSALHDSYSSAGGASARLARARGSPISGLVWRSVSWEFSLSCSCRAVSVVGGFVGQLCWCLSGICSM